ncbi:MAG TPA: glycosyl hydrolase family 28 protein [Candidatus Aquilonibacter sp.]|nr:glycosyl hydrolase family 28 protein [Candidatus Aquilonibacter sp.]
MFPRSLCLSGIVLLSACVSPAIAQSVLHASDFGAVGDGKTLTTAALQRALDAAAARAGEVELKPGIYLTGALFLKSHTHLVLDKGAVVLGTTRKDLYPLVQTRAAGIEMQWPAALLNIAGQTDVSIEGQGTIDGDGDPWWKEFWDLVPAYESRGLRWAVDYDVQRPELIRIYNSNSVRIGNGLMLRRSAFWTVHICYSTHVVVSGVTIRDNDVRDVRGPSTDGVDIDSSSHVLVEKIDIENNDDGICLKAGMNADGLRVDRPTEDVTIRDSIIRQGISGIAIGSDTAGGFKNIKVYGITILGGVRYGIYLKSTRTRGGWTDNVVMSHIVMEGVQTAIKIDLNYFPAFSTPKIPRGIERNLPSNRHAIPDYWHILTAPVDAAKGVPHFRDVTLENIRASGVGTAFSVNAAPDAPLVRFTLKGIHIDAERAGSLAHTREWTFQDVTIHTQDGAPLKLDDVEQSHGAIKQL